jgi:hypothetical protein
VAMAALVPSLSWAAVVLAFPVAASAILIAVAGAETRNRHLEELDV